MNRNVFVFVAIVAVLVAAGAAVFFVPTGLDTVIIGNWTIDIEAARKDPRNGQDLQLMEELAKRSLIEFKSDGTMTIMQPRPTPDGQIQMVTISSKWKMLSNLNKVVTVEISQDGKKDANKMEISVVDSNHIKLVETAKTPDGKEMQASEMPLKRMK